MNKLPIGFKRYRIFEPETKWHGTQVASSPDKARDKAWVQTWLPILNKNGFLHFKKESLEVREL